MRKISEGAARRPFDLWLLVLFAALVIGAILRFWGLTTPSLSHPEIYIPGIDLIPHISEPPPRHAFLETLEWHFQSETHPVGYFMAMWAWTSIAGTSEFALRFPGVAIGIFTIWLVWRLGKEIFSSKVGAVAAFLLAIDGFHVYWSQTARMYAPCASLAVLATLMLVIWMQAGERRPGLETGYAAALIAGTQTVELFWAVPFLHLAWVSMVTPTESRPDWKALLLPWKVPAFRIVQVQTIAMALAAADFVHIARKAGVGSAALDPTPRFLTEYMGFGFLFQTGAMRSTLAAPSLAAALAMAALSLLFAVSSLRSPASRIADAFPAPVAFRWVALATALGTALAYYLVLISPRHKGLLAVVALLPVLCLWLPGLSAIARSIVGHLPQAMKQALDRFDTFHLLLLLIAFVPPLVFYVLSQKMSVLAPRAFLPFTPFLLLLVAAGMAALLQVRWIAIPVSLGVVALFATSSVYFHNLPHSPRDYKLIARVIAREEQSGDVIFVRPRHWQDTPLFYYLPRAHYVVDDHARYLALHNPPRVWLPEWLTEKGALELDERSDILAAAGYQEVRSWPALEARAGLFARKPTQRK